MSAYHSSICQIHRETEPIGGKEISISDLVIKVIAKSNFIMYSDGIVVIWEVAIEPTPSGKIASMWIDNITVRSLIFCHAGLTIQTLIL
jgi:hypothetical protein